MWQNLEPRCSWSCWLITHMNHMTDTWAVLCFPVDLHCQCFLQHQVTLPRRDGLLLEPCLSRKMVQSLLFIKNPNQLLSGISVLAWCQDQTATSAQRSFFISCPDRMLSVLLKYCENTMIMDRSINLNPWMLTPGCWCPRHHCLYGEMQADGKSG